MNPRTVRAWETGRDLIPVRVADEVAALKRRHDQTVAELLGSDAPIGIVRDKSRPHAPAPRGWYVAAAAICGVLNRSCAPPYEGVLWVS